MGLRTRTALAAAARSRGYETEYDDAIADLCRRLADLDTDAPTLPTAREGVPDGHIAELREAAAEARGRLRAREELDADTEAVEAAVRESTSTLAERETERTAARESRRRRRETAREYRDRAARRRRLADRLANRRRDARRELASRFADRFRQALETVPGPGPTPADPFEARPVPAALAVLRLARTPAPVVLEADRFGHPTAAADWLGAPVVRC
jgi:chromosome segregation ATPase